MSHQPPVRRPGARRPVPPEYRWSPPSGPSRAAAPASGSLSLVLTLTTLGLLFILAFNGWLLTRREVGVDYLRHALARFTEVDRLLVRGADNMRAAAEGSPDGTVRLAGFPVDVELPSSAVAEADLEELRAALLQVSAERIYDDGERAFVDRGGGEAGSRGFLSAGNILRRTLLLVNDGSHRGLTLVCLLLGVVSLLLAFAIWARRRDPASSLTAIGTALMASAVTAMAVALVVRGLARLAADIQTEYLAVQLLHLVADTTTLILRTGGIFIIFGAALGLTGWFIGSIAAVERRA